MERKSKKRGNNEGSIWQRADGRWAAGVTLENGTRKSYYGKSREEVAKKLASALKAHQDGLPLAPEKQTVAAFLPEWLESAKPGLKPRTIDDYDTVVRLHLVPTLGKVRLVRLTPQHVQALMASKLKDGLSPRRVQIIQVVLHRALRQAEQWGLVSRNVASLVDRPKVHRHEIEPLTPEDARKLLDSLKGDRLEALYSVALAVGLRRGEALGLRWKDIDLEAKHPSLRVTQALQRYGGSLHLDEPKTERSRRTIVLPQVVVNALRRHMVRQLEERLKLGPAWNDAGLVFTTMIGTPLEPRNVLRHFKAALVTAEIEEKRFHDLRHTSASLLLAQGVAPRVVMEILGHGSIGITMDIYSHVMPALERDAAAKMDDALTATVLAQQVRG